MGAQATAFAATEQIWQPLVWQGAALPRYQLSHRFLPLPGALHPGDNGRARQWAWWPTPGEFPFMPLPSFENSRFGVAVRNAAGEAQPILAAPILGGTGSHLNAGEATTFRFCPYVTTGDTTIAFERIAREIYDFRDVRHNQIGSLNQALENMVDYGMSDYSEFLVDEKGCSYATDAPGTVKNVSSLSPLDMALSTDNQDIWDLRAYPYIEYMLSRAKFLFTIDESQNVQSPSYTLEGPVAPISELVSLNRISNGASVEMIELAETEYARSRVRNLNVSEPGDSWQNALHLYRATGQASYLQNAIDGADAYIARRITDLPESFNDPDASLLFWTGYAPRFIDLLLLYEATGEQRFLDASWTAARFFAMHCWIAPGIPDENVTVNEGNQAPVYWYLADRTVGPISVPEESVPAWRVSAQGLTCESSGTSTGHRAIFMANFAPWFLRIGWLKDDDFLRDIARSAIVGRWMNFPGYHMNTGRTTVYEKPDFPLRPFNELSYNSFHFNHIWPMMSIAFDYLVTDAETRSNGAISFQREYIEGYVYLQSSFYGMRPGTFHGEDPVRLWMPKGLADISSNELNYIAARGADTLCLAFTSQGFAEETATVNLDTSLAPELAGLTRTARVWIDNQPEADIQVVDGSFSITVPAKGIVSVVIDNTVVSPVFQDGFADLSADDAWLDGHLEWPSAEAPTAPGARALVLNFGSGYRSFFFHLKDSKTDFTSLRLRYEIDGRNGEVTDDAFPWEFTVPLEAGDRLIRYELEATRPDGGVDVFGPSMLIQDNAIIEVSPSALSVPEGGTNTFEVRLLSLPDSDVTVNVTRTSGDSDLSVTAGGTLVFTPANGTDWQQITLAAAEDADNDYGTATFTCTDPAGGYLSASLDATEADNDNLPPVVDAGDPQTLDMDSTSPWTPAQTSTNAWFDAHDAATITVSGGVVSQWDDKSGNGHHAVQGDPSRQPVYQISDPMAGGLPSIGNAGSSGSVGLLTPSLTAGNVYVVTYYKDGLDADFDGYSTIFSGAGTFGQYRVMGTLDTDDFIGTYNFNDAGTFRNGSETSSLAAALPMPATLFKFKSSTPRTQTFALGYNQLDADRDWQGSYCEFVFTDGSEDPAGEDTMEGYLAHKWGLQANLPADHPYKAEAPMVTAAVGNLEGDVSDPNSDLLTTLWTVAAGPQAAVSFGDATAANTSVAISAPGVYTLRLTASDGNVVSTGDVVITVDSGSTPVNSPPVWSTDPLVGIAGTRDVAYSSTLAGAASDADGNPLTYAKVDGPVWLAVAADGGLSGTPGQTNLGPNSFTVSASDGIAAPVEATLNITVLDVTPSPVSLVASFDSVGRSTTATPIDKTYAGNLAVGPVSGSDYFRSYLTFDLSSATTATGDTTLTFATSGFGAGENENNTSSVPQVFTLFSLPADWDGATQPGPTGTILATLNFTPATGDDNQVLSFSSAALTTAFNNAVGGNLYLGIMSDAEGTNARSFKWLGSTEDSGFEPQLIYTADSGSGGDTFATWIDTYYPGETDEAIVGLGTDPDSDGNDNGVENFFGTAPDAFSRGLIMGNVDPGTGAFTFTHPQGTLAGDLTAAYTWSKDLVTFFPEGTGDGTTVSFSTVPDPPMAGTLTTVTVAVTGTPVQKLFVRVEVTLNPLPPGRR